MTSPVPLRRYETAVSLSAGGTAEIFKAYDPSLQRYVALKFLRREDPVLVERMFREARAQARLEHDGICKVYEVGELEGRPYIAMQYIDGVELGVAVVEMTLEDKVQVIMQVAEAVHAAHKEGLIHRDLKPANVMVQTTEDGRFKPVVVDFGLVWEHETEAMTQVGQVLGTPPYLAPEQVEGRRDQLDRRTDIYGLGATLYHLLCGRPPFEGESNVELLVKTVHEEPLRLQRIDPSIPSDLETIVAKCLEKERHRRYDSAQALAADLRRFLDGEPILARPASTIYRLRKSIRKHRLLFAVSSTAALLLLAALGAILLTRWQADKRLEFEQRFAQIGKDADWTMRVEYMSSPHDIVPAKNLVRQRIAELEAELEEVGRLGRGPAHYAIGRCYQALHEDDKARYHLEEAWNLGYRTPEVAYGLGLVIGRQYDDQLRRAKNTPDKGIRNARLHELKQAYRKPAVEYLRHGQDTQTVAVEYVEALLAFHEEEYETALNKLSIAIERLPWLYEAHILEGDLHIQWGIDQWLEGETEAAWSSFRSAEPAYRKAIASAGSDPRAYLGLCQTALSMMRLEGQSPGENMAFYFEKVNDSCEQARLIDRELAFPYIRESEAYRIWARYQSWTGNDPTPAFERGLELAQQGIERAPDNHRALTILGLNYLQKGEHLSMLREVDPRPSLRLAAQSLERALEMDPNNASILNILGSTRLQTATYELRNGIDATESVEQAIREYEAGLKITEDAFDLHCNLGNAYDFKAGLQAERGEDYESSISASIRHIKRSIEINEDQDWAFLELGDSYSMRAGYRFAKDEDPFSDLDLAIEYTQRAIEINPNVSEYYNRMVNLSHRYAYFQLSIGEDPDFRLSEARRWIDEHSTRVANVIPHGQRVVTEALALRWSVQKGESPDLLIRRADRELDRMEDFEQDLFYFSTGADYLIWRATWELLQDQRSKVRRSLDQGFDLIARALQMQPESATMISNRGCLLVLAAQVEEDEQKRLTLLQEAEASLERSLVLNRWLAKEIDPWLAQARKLAGKGPIIEEQID